MDETNKLELINKIIALLSMTHCDTGQILLVKRPTIASILDSCPASLLADLAARIPEYPPSLDTPEWVIWFKNTCAKFQIPREKFIENALVDKGDLSKFESNKKDFGISIRKRLLKVICDEINVNF